MVAVHSLRAPNSVDAYHVSQRCPASWVPKEICCIPRMFPTKNSKNHHDIPTIPPKSLPFLGHHPFLGAQIP